jgi:hypothetical protein
MALVLTGAFDWYFVVRFRDQLVVDHLDRYLAETKHAVILAAAISIAFVLAILVLRWTTPRVASVLMAAIVIASCIYYLPTNFFQSSAGSAASGLHIPGTQPRRGAYLSFLATAQQPTTYNSVQIWGPIMPKAYQKILKAMFSDSETFGYGALYDAVPSLGFAIVNPRLIHILGSLGVDQLVISVALPPSSTFGEISRCGVSTAATESSTLCFLGRSTNIGGPPASRGFAYEILGTSPLVETNPQLVAVTSTNAGLTDILRHLSPTSTAFPRYAYVTSSGPAPRVARGVVGLSRTATTQTIAFSLRSRTAGLAVLRSSYLQGMHASVNGRSVAALPVDGGLWTAVDIGTGRSRVLLSYESTADRVEFGLAVIGLLGLAVAWLGLAALIFVRRRTPVGGSGPTVSLGAAAQG